MPHWGYSLKEIDETRMVKASLREVDVSPKWSREVCKAIVGLTIPEARKLLEEVVAMKRMIPYRRYKKKRAHHAQTKGPGGYPVKVAKHMLKLLDSLEANADFKGFDPDEVVIIHAAAHKGRRIRKFIERAFGRATPYDKQLVHIEVVGEVKG
ncbi:MAG: 50S ribosomal protein L22 [Thaumarchaeota archaeon]|nr:MAG: 50S ribosomal protein L22 [Candidatus Wolframiiraptor sp.]RLG08953.1 MAG: 50S ribosomal protein L22 [Nitrososphaerota archaeon]HDD39667.1 50S ribosomal protein L22 [Nitrososphaeria archaeon]